MSRVLAMCLDAAIAGIILIPLFVLLNKFYYHSKIRCVFFTLFGLYLCGMYAVVGLPDIRYVRFDPNYNIIPFAYMFSDFTNSFLNILLFIPMGFFLPVFWDYYRKMHRTVLFGFFASFIIETLQIFTFRASDINDLLTNTTGTLIGWCCAKWVLSMKSGIVSGGNHRELFVICISSFVIMFFLQPYLANWIIAYLL